MESSWWHGVQSGQAHPCQPMPPAPQCCAACGAPGAPGAPAATVEAIDRAVAKAFAELQPALFQAVAAAISDHDDGRAPKKSLKATRFASRGWMASSESSILSVDGGVGDGTQPPSSLPIPSSSLVPKNASVLAPVSESPTERSAGSAWTPAPKQPASRPMTVQAMHASIAQAVLDGMGVGFNRQSSRGSATPDGLHARRHSNASHFSLASDFTHARRHSEVSVSDFVPVLPAFESSLGGDMGSAADTDSSRSPGDFDKHAVRRMTGFARAAHRRGLGRTSSQVIRARFSELAQLASRSTGRTLFFHSEGSPTATTPTTTSTFSAAPLALLLWGILPLSEDQHKWWSKAYQLFAKLVVMLSATAFTFLLYAGPMDFKGFEIAQGRKLFCRLSLPAGALLVSLPFLLLRHQTQLDEAFQLVQAVSVRRQYEAWSQRQARRDRLVFVLLWIGVVVATAMDTYISGDRCLEHVVLHSALSAICGGVSLSLSYAVVFVARSLTTMIDAFCCDVVGQTDLHEVAYVWNLTQAVLRKASDSIGVSLLALCGVVMFKAPLLVVDIGSVGAYGAPLVVLGVLPGLCVAFGVLYMFFLAATISEQCARIPSLVNAISFGEGTEKARQQTVQHITSSEAGF